MSANLTQPPDLPDGPACAAILAAGIGSFALASLAIAAGQLPALKNALTFYRPTGVLSGVTTIAILIWLAAWLSLNLRWRRQNVPVPRICALSFVLLALSFLLTFPPIADLF